MHLISVRIIAILRKKQFKEKKTHIFYIHTEVIPKSPKKNPRYDPSKRERKQSSRQSQNVVYVLAEFALELMRILETFNKENFQSDGKLKVGKMEIKHIKISFA